MSASRINHRKQSVPIIFSWVIDWRRREEDVTNKMIGRRRTWSYDKHRRPLSVSSESAVSWSTFSLLPIRCLLSNTCVISLFSVCRLTIRSHAPYTSWHAPRIKRANNPMMLHDMGKKKKKLEICLITCLTVRPITEQHFVHMTLLTIQPNHVPCTMYRVSRSHLEQAIGC